MSGRQTIKGQQTRAAILATAVNISSIEGLEGLTIGRLAAELDMSKSGLFGHFGSKEELQLATVEVARQIFIDEVITPARQAERGLARLWALCDAWLSYMEREVFPGGCFFMSASAEFDNRPGPIRDQVATQMMEWLDYLSRNVQIAQSLGQLIESPEPAQLAFELHALALGADWAMQLYEDEQAPNRARRAILTRLHTLITSQAPPLPQPEEYP
jgi:AcrR family transcriptional regulator